MKQYWMRRVGDATRFELRDVPRPEPGPQEVLVRVRASSFNYGDVFARIGRHRADVARPAGVDAAGEVAAVGSGVSGIAPGSRVMARIKGSFGEYAIASVHEIMPVPERLDWPGAAAVPIAYITAHEALCQLGGLAPGETVLVAGASSGVGVACVQIAKTLGARVIGTSGSSAKIERLRALGMDAGIAARGGDFGPAVVAANDGHGVDLAIDLVGGSAFPACQAALADFGRLGVVGYVDGQMRAPLDLEALHGKRLRIFGASNTPLSAPQRALACASFVRDILPLVEDGRIVPVVDRVFAFGDIDAAMDYVASGALLGKVVLALD